MDFLGTLKMPERRDNAGAVCDSGMDMSFFCILGGFHFGIDFFLSSFLGLPSFMGLLGILRFKRLS